MGGLAIVAGRGVLPRLIAEDCERRGHPYRLVVFEGVSLGWAEGHPVVNAAFEKPGRLFADLRAANCTEVTFAGGLKRPELNPLRFDFKMLKLAPKILAGLRAGDDVTLRLVGNIFESEGIVIRAPHEILGDLLAPSGVLTKSAPSSADREDVERAVAIVTALGKVDAGQGAVVGQGLCLAVESIQGTDAMLKFVAETASDHRPDPSGARGVLYKAPKSGQDWRIDLPAIGPDTLRMASQAGLAGVAVQAGGVLILGLEETIAAANETGLFLWGREGAD